MLYRVREGIPPRVPGQNVVYIVGEISVHKVAVVGYYQEQGLTVSGSMVAEVKRDLPSLQFGLLVGIAGGLPSPARDIQLGEVAVAVPEGDRPGSATHHLLQSINIIRAHNESGFWRHLRIDDREFQKPDGQPAHANVHYGTVLSGNTVIKSKARRDYLKNRYGGITVKMMTRLPVAVIGASAIEM
ncbi:uncharacterized protein LDX57_005834 [Aspergillus melleus]|uniref:uncharacterized protein n=1 Tax=Aspergillus melleus TaxID=138277 RepID=UPI001E8D6AD4|nr:uncharacterized protein LDX57_005834 [Aspergillus melleus]KAH8428129.1 hypothetical protein LDX57_005834 [Aspergillus melleus]